MKVVTLTHQKVIYIYIYIYIYMQSRAMLTAQMGRYRQLLDGII